ncbi:hypothetical protein [Sinosporangium siamense]|uniref:Uncharacterized protein n=1 Tax=Sinosporangium siamense TaxID=1367973 RepID=A0A919RSC2_9ACTN|nr:hypothetical protein [Sinosporangium siamense]GII97389.1 hypothetical protein Ssi02_76200 [Sinosporangium siamense]
MPDTPGPDDSRGHGPLGEGSLGAPDRKAAGRARKVLAGAVFALFAGYLLYEVLHAGSLEQTALFYVGIPAVVALSVVWLARPASLTGTVMATMTVGLALAGPLLGEGIVCLFIAAPLFYLVALAVMLIAGAISDRKRHALLLVPLLGALSLEGAVDVTTVDRAQEVSVTLAAHGVDVTRALAGTPRFGPVDSPLLRLGFPRPLSSEGEGLAVGATRRITFTPRKSLGLGAEFEPRSLTLRITESSPGRAVFTVVEDTTLARWMRLREAEFRWNGDRLTVTVRYDRTFDPAWYFGPVQRYAVGEAAGYLARTFTA